MSVSNVLISFLEERGVRNIFGVSGAKIERFFHEVHVQSKQVSVTITKHEAVAVSAADSTARCGADFGAVAVTSGGAAFNIVPGLAEAYSKNTPMFVIVGQPTNAVNHHGGFQESSGKNDTPLLEQTLSAVSRWCRTLQDPSHVYEYLSEIEALLLHEKSGPAVLLVPENIFQETVLELPPSTNNHVPDTVVDTHVLERIHREELVIIAGGEILKQNAYDAVDELCSTLQLPVVTVSDGKHAIDNTAGFYSGSIGAMGHRSAFAAVKEAKQLLIIGARLREIDRLEISLAGKECFFVGNDAPFINDYTTMGKHIPSAAQALVKRFDTKSTTIDIPIPLKQYERENLYVETLTQLNKQFRAPVNILVDAGNGGAYAMHYLFPPKGSIINIALTMGGMGYSFGAALGAALHNGRRTYQIAGDGSFFMHGFEVETALRMNLPITFLIFDNSGHQMCVTREQLYFAEESGNNRFLHSRIGKGFATMYDNLPACDIYSAEQLSVQFSKYADHAGPVLFVIHVDDREIPPFLPFERESE